MATPSYPGKSADLISLGDGLNYSTPLSQVTSGTVVPTALFFLRSNNPPPTVSPTDWRLRVDGLVKRPLTLSLSDIQTLPSVTQEIWLECAGNSRKRWDPPGEGNQWDDQAISNARFTGVPLASVLDQAGVEPDAVEVVTTGADAETFQRGLPVDVARQSSVLLVWAMNDEPIPVPNGGPIRLVVPGWAGIASVKWPVRMEVIGEPFRGYWNAERYIMVDRNGSHHGAVREMPVKSIIAFPTRGAQLEPKRQTAFGFAWSGHAGIATVDVSVDGQRTWTAARLIRGGSPTAWTRWEFDWEPSAEHRSLAVRATDQAGNVQPTEAFWNKFGYLMNAIVTHDFTVACAEASAS